MGILVPLEKFVAEDVRPPAFTDEALALRFAEMHADDLRYVAAWSKWLHWTGTRWKLDETLLAFDFARAVCREAAAQCNNEKTAATLASAKTVAAVERLAKADRRLAATVDQWDVDPWTLNTPRRRHRSPDRSDASAQAERLHHQDHCRVCPAAPARPGSAFLDRVTAGDFELAVLHAADVRLRAHRRHDGPCAVLPVRHRRQRQVRHHRHRRRHPERLSPHRADRDVHRIDHRAASDRSGWAPRCAARYRRRDRGRQALGREPHQDADRRRQNCCSLHAAGLSSSSRRSSSWLSLAITSRAFGPSTRRSGAGSIWCRSR